MALPTRLRKSIQKQATDVLETGSRFKRFDQLRQRHFWSEYFFAPNANGYILSGTFPVFVVPPGQNGQGFPSGVTLTERETNWKSQNRVPDNQNFEITELGVSSIPIAPDVFNPDEPRNAFATSRMLNQFLNNTVLSITYLTNSVPLGLIGDFGQASAPHVGSYVPELVGPTEIPDSRFMSNGIPAPALRRRFKIPILLQHGETFSFAFNILRDFFIGTGVNSGTRIILRMDFWATESFVEKS